MNNNNHYLYIGLYVFIFLTILFGVQFLSTKSSEYLEKRKKKPPRCEQEETTTGNIDDIFNTTYETTCTTSVHESYDLDEIVKTTKGRSKGEKICRYFLEEIYQKPFPSTYPAFLRNPKTGVPLELDGYNEELG